MKFSAGILASSLPKTSFTASFAPRLKNADRVTGDRKTTRASFDYQPPTPKKVFIQRHLSSEKGDTLLVPYGVRNAGNAEGDHRALDAVNKLYSAIKQRNLGELSNVIGDECRCVCNFIPYFHLFHGKKEVLELFSQLMRYMGQNIEFVVQPTLHNGMTVSVKWKLVWDKTHVPLGAGFSFYVCHTYNGKVVIKNMEMLMEPIFHIEPLRLKMMAFVMPVVERIGSHSMVKGRGSKIMFLSIGLVGILMFLALWKLAFH
ncbi:hypothetical protein ACHQM5_002668 [Ranunculus cassubicifolius]